MEKGKISLLAIGIVLGFILVLCVAGYFLFTEDSTLVSQTQNTNPPPSTSDSTASWNLMTNSELGFNLKYPNNFFDGGHEPKIFTGSCNYANLPDTCDKALTGWFFSDSNQISWQNPSGQSVTINGANYLLCQEGDAATGHQYYYDYYVTVRNQKCQVVELDTSTSTCENYLPLEQGNAQQGKNYNDCLLQRDNRPKILQQITNTFTFTPK